nr:MAG TPA: major capsid protein [Caudoviricetes sp.]
MEMDAYAASTLASAASSFGSVDDTALTASNILETWDSYLAYMVNQRVPRDRIRCKMTPDTYKLLKEAAGITRFVSADTGIRDIDRNAGKLDGVLIMEVPSDVMQTAYDFTSGWVAASGAQQINMLMFDPLAIAAPVVYDTSMMTAPTAQSKGKWLYYERYYYDVFALNQRLPGIFANIAATPTISNNLTVTSVAGGSGQTVVTLAEAIPYGMTAYYKTNTGSATTPTYGEDISSWTPFVNGAAITATSGHYITVALANTTGVPGGPAYATQYGTAVIVSGS